MGIVQIYTNNILNGWSPHDLNKKGLGGSEEAITYLACEFVKLGHSVDIYTTLTQPSTTFEGVNFLNHSDFDIEKHCDLFISFKNRDIWSHDIKATKKIHFSLEVEPYWNNQCINTYVYTSEFHRSRHPWTSNRISKVIPLGVNMGRLNSTKKETRENGRILYCSSPDRGLYNLLMDWEFIKQNHAQRLTLNVAYSFKIIDKIAEKNKQVFDQVSKLRKLLDQDGVSYLGSLNQDEINEQYQQANYWVLPLELPESELFCLNAIKSRFYGCTPVVNKIGALKETVGAYIPYVDFVNGNNNVKEIDSEKFNAMDWEEVVSKYWSKII